MNLLEVLEKGLRTEGFDGLVVPGVCGCVIGDLSPGNCLREECELGYKHAHSITGDWIVSTKREGVTDEEIERVIDECC